MHKNESLTPEICIKLACCLDAEAYISRDSEDQQIPLLIQYKLMLLILNRCGLALNARFDPLRIAFSGKSEQVCYELFPKYITTHPACESNPNWTEVYNSIDNRYNDIAYCFEMNGEYSDLAILGYIMNSNWCGFDEICIDDINEWCSMYYDFVEEYNNIKDEKEYSNWILSLLQLAHDCQEAEGTGDTSSKQVADYALYISDAIFDEKIPVKLVLQNLSFFVKNFLSQTDYVIESYGYFRIDLPTYIHNRHLFQNVDLKNALDKAIDIFMDPMPYCIGETLPISEIYDNYAFTLMCYGYSDGIGDITSNSLRPFWTLACNIIDVLLPIALKEINLQK